MKQVLSFLVLLVFGGSRALPMQEDEGVFADGPIDLSNSTGPKDLYVIKTIVYEVGILTDASNDTSNSTEITEEVDLTFFNPTHNGSTIDLSNIPVPIQANISGISITGIAPVNFGTFDLKGDDKNLLVAPLNGSAILPNAVISVTQNVSTVDSEKGEEILKQISPLLNLQNGTLNAP
ncbi:PREDICTED: uncharacterized protein LOC108560303 [Nicrophorus vespilloides]|uniref:Uncharacterized protein LOC108560303 n=1 Tax=Nicrophorus vespilloides TaxID=110193 RepID=A0ABM1MFC4_NICVS|nr:PREDICTED: uncharacterized protein LOC108560303 [Nicrophorus vespilloides]